MVGDKCESLQFPQSSVVVFFHLTRMNAFLIFHFLICTLLGIKE